MEAAKIVKDDTGQYNYLQGEVIIPIDATSILKSIDSLEKCNAGTWVAFARLNDIPAEPFHRKLLKPVLMGILQNAWYLAFNESGVPEKCVLNQETRVKKYLEDLEKSKTTPVVESSRKSSEPKAPRSVKTYRLVKAKREDWSKYKGQKKLIVEAFVALGAVGNSNGVASATIADAIKDQLETKQPAERVVAFYMNVFTHEGIVDSPGDQPALVEPVVETAAPVAEEPTPKAKGKKK